MVDVNPDNSYSLVDQVEWEEEGSGALQVIFEDGKFMNLVTLTEVRERLSQEIPELQAA